MQRPIIAVFGIGVLYSADSVVKRASIARGTLYRVEKGDAGVSLATYASVLRVLGLQGDLDLVARDDVLGRKLQDLNLPTRKVAPRRAQASRKNSAADLAEHRH